MIILAIVVALALVVGGILIARKNKNGINSILSDIKNLRK